MPNAPRFKVIALAAVMLLCSGNLAMAADEDAVMDYSTTVAEVLPEPGPAPTEDAAIQVLEAEIATQEPVADPEPASENGAESDGTQSREPDTAAPESAHDNLPATNDQEAPAAAEQLNAEEPTVTTDTEEDADSLETEDPDQTEETEEETEVSPLPYPTASVDLTEFVAADESGSFDLGESETISIVFPTSVYGEPVLRIGESAFQGCDLIDAVVISEDIVEIGKDAFADCENLKTIILLPRDSWDDVIFGENWSGDAEVVILEAEAEAEE